MRVGIIGCGTVSRNHIVATSRLPGVEVVGVCDTDREKAVEAARLFGIKHAYQDAASMLRELEPNVVHVATPPGAHRDLSIMAMEAGCHVLVEKPMALDASEADEMLDASRRHQVTLGVCHNLLFLPAILEARELVARGELGEVVDVDMFMRMYREGPQDRLRTIHWFHELPGGVFHEAAPHPVYLLKEFLRSLSLVSAVLKTFPGDLPSPSGELRVLFEGEVGLGSCLISVHAKPYLKFLDIYGTKMSVRVNLNNNTIVKFRRDGLTKVSKALVNIGQSLQLMSKTATNTLGTLLGLRTLGHGALIKAFYESIRKGVEPPVTGEDGREVVALLDQVWAKLEEAPPAGRAE